MIGRLQRIKDLRLDRAEQQLATQQARLQLAHSRQREAEQESLDYRQWRLAEEDRLFALCQAEQLDRKGLKAWQQQVALLREKEAQLEQTAVEQAERVAEERIRLQERQLAVQKKKGTLVDRARAETLVFRLARQERDVWVTWPGRVAALMAAQIMAEVERQSGASVTIETAIMQRVLEAHVREQLDALADLRVSLA